MAKDIYEENKELSRTLYIIEKAILDFRLKQLDLPLERVNCPSVFSPNVASVPSTVTTTCDECDKEKEDLRQQIVELTNKLNTANEELDTFKKKDCERKVEEVEVEISNKPKECWYRKNMEEFVCSPYSFLLSNLRTKFS